MKSAARFNVLGPGLHGQCGNHKITHTLNP